MKITIYNKEIFIVLRTSVSEIKLIFLVDTGSQVSLIKAEKILDAKVNTKNKIEIIGISDNKTIHSLGTTKALLNFNGHVIEHQFHVMHENLFLKMDGIIGADFLIKYGATINIQEKLIIMKSPNLPSNANKQHEVKIMKFFRVKDKEIQNPRQNDQYINALENYIEYENNFVRQISARKIKNDHFYDNLSNDFAKKAQYEKINSCKVEIDESFKKLLYDPYGMERSI